MALTARVDELRKKHEQLSSLIEQEQRSPGSDDLAISKLKRQKLKLKEEIERNLALMN